MPIYYTTTDGEPPNGGRTPAQQGPPPCYPPVGPPPAPPGYIPYPPPMFFQPRIFSGPPPSYRTEPESSKKTHTGEPKEEISKKEKPKEPTAKPYGNRACPCKKHVRFSSPDPPSAETVTAASPSPNTGYRVVPPDRTPVLAHAQLSQATVLIPSTVLINLVQKWLHPWLHPHCLFDFTVHEVPTSITVKELVEVIRPKEDKERHKGVIEAIELGGGRWMMGQRLNLSGEGADSRLSEIGWSGQRGREKKNVWIAYG